MFDVLSKNTRVLSQSVQWGGDSSASEGRRGDGTVGGTTARAERGPGLWRTLSLTHTTSPRPRQR